MRHFPSIQPSRTSTKRPKLLVVIPGKELGGAERYAFRIAAAMSDHWEVATVIWNVSALDPLSTDLRIAGLLTFRLSRHSQLGAFASLTTILLLYRPDVVHFDLPWPVGATALRLACFAGLAPTVTVHHLVPHSHTPGLRRRVPVWMLTHRQRWAAVSRFGQEMLSAFFGVDPSTITVIHNAPRCISTRTSVSDTEATRRRFAISDRDDVLLTVGRLDQIKGQDVLVDAASRLARSRDRLHVLIAGEGPARADLEAQIGRLGLTSQIRLLGAVEDVSSLLSITDVFVFPSRLEGMPLALMEAMTAGVPVVATRFGGADEVVAAEETGILVEMDNPDALAAGIERLLDDQKLGRQMARAATQSVAQFSERQMLDETAALLRETMLTWPRRKHGGLAPRSDSM